MYMQASPWLHLSVTACSEYGKNKRKAFSKSDRFSTIFLRCYIDMIVFKSWDTEEVVKYCLKNCLLPYQLIPHALPYKPTLRYPPSDVRNKAGFWTSAFPLGLLLSPEAGPFLQHLPHSILSQVLASPKCKFSVSQSVLLVKGQGCLVLPESQTSSACEILSP